MKLTKQQKKEIVRKHDFETPPPYTEGHWEDAMLANDNYYDIDILNKHNKPIYKKIEEWKEKYDEASSWLGKWYCQAQIDKLKNKLKHYQ